MANWIKAATTHDAYSELMGACRQRTPEERLFEAVLLHALDDMSRRRLARSTAEWFESSATRWPCSFIAVCRALDLDPGCVRRVALGKEAPK